MDNFFVSFYFCNPWTARIVGTNWPISMWSVLVTLQMRYTIKQKNESWINFRLNLLAIDRITCTAVSVKVKTFLTSTYIPVYLYREANSYNLRARAKWFFFSLLGLLLPFLLLINYLAASVSRDFQRNLLGKNGEETLRIYLVSKSVTYPIKIGEPVLVMIMYIANLHSKKTNCRKNNYQGCKISFQRRISFPLLQTSFPLLVQIFAL